jgi:6-phosphogluconolactonase (cycloisomerase 2 family)
VVAISSNTASVAGFAVGSAHITATEALSSPVTGTIPVTVVAVRAHYAYVSNNLSNTIQWYSVNTSTSPYLTSQGTLAQSNGIGATQTVIHPFGLYLYYTDNQSNIWVATIDSSTGALTATAFPGQVAGFGNANFTVIDPYGRFLYVSDDAGNTIYGFQINQTDGSLALISGSPFSAHLDSPECLVIDHTGNYLYATNSVNSTISAYTINQTTGALTALSTPTFPSGTGTAPVLGALDPSGTHLYVANTLSNSIAGFSIGTGGVLTSLGTDTAVTGAIAVENLVVDPTGARIYVLDSGSAASVTGQVFGFLINSGGVIGAAISGTPIATGTSPLGAIVIDPTDAILAVDNNGSNDISLYTIGSGGALTAATPPTVSTGTAPLYVTFNNAP